MKMFPLIALAGGGLLLVAMRKPAHAAALPQPTTASTPPEGGHTGTAPTSDEQYLVAVQLIAHLKMVRRYAEDQDQVRAYQAANGLVADGKYGPGTALSIASHGVVPVVPFYWNKTTSTQQKAAYKTGISQYEKQYPSLDWSTAIQGDGLHPSVDVSGVRS